jgi:hypothetical protein
MRLIQNLLLASVFLSGAVQAKMLDLANPDDALTVYRKTQCSTDDNAPVVYRWTGRAYSRVPGEQDRLLFNLEGMNIRQCVTITDPKRGKGFRQVSREIMLYIDPKTGKPLSSWANPWSGETVDVVQVANDPVNMRSPAFPIGADGKPFDLGARRDGDWLFMPTEVPLYYENALGGQFQDYIGGKYQAMEIFDFSARADVILDPKTKMGMPVVAWVRVSDWLPWMKMRGRAGQMIFNATGRMLGSFDELPAVMKEQIATNYPEWKAPPPVDDARPNETSWTYFKKKLKPDGVK